MTVQSGQVVGLIGGNGAGKSTLLKAVVGVLKPSEGQIELWGRPHLLAPGMGLNRKLSGRENVILGGLAAGMSLEEVQKGKMRSSSSLISAVSLIYLQRPTRRECLAALRSQLRPTLTQKSS